MSAFALLELLLRVLTVLCVAMIFGAIIWIPAYRFHLRKGPKYNFGTFERTIYLLPAVALLWLGIFPRRPGLLSITGLPPFTWFLVLLAVTVVGLRYCKRGMGAKDQSLKEWLWTWPGIAGPEPAVESPDTAPFKFDAVTAIPLLAGLTSIAELFAKLAGFYKQIELASFLEFALAAASVGACVHVLSASKDQESGLGTMRPVARYPKTVRTTTVATGLLVLSFWAVASGTEPRSDLAIVSAQLPQPHARKMTLTLVNKGDVVRILTGFEIETRTWLAFQCKSSEFNIPSAGQYKLKFQLSNPLTTAPAIPNLQFQHNRPGTVDIVLEPDATGNCQDGWTADVRVAVVSDDGQRSTTKWFTLNSAR
jgi:hypothetical protein